MDCIDVALTEKMRDIRMLCLVQTVLCEPSISLSRTTFNAHSVCLPGNRRVDVSSIGSWRDQILDLSPQFARWIEL